MNQEELEKKGIEQSLKSMDTEEWIDLIFYRPMGYRWALFFNKLGVKPNAITIASIVLGVLAGVCFYPKSFWINLLGVVLLVWANTYDSTDGQLARLTNQKSELGRILDGAAGDLWFIAIYLAIVLRLTPTWGIWIWLLAALAGYCHSKQAAMADYYRNIHLFFLKGKRGSEHDTYLQQERLYRQMTWKKDSYKKLFQWFYKGYTRGQEQLSPCFQRFFKKLLEVYGEYDIPVELRDDFRKGSFPLLKYTNMLTFNLRATVLCISVIIGQPWIYFVFEVTVLNIVLFYMVRKHEKLSTRMYHKLTADEK